MASAPIWAGGFNLDLGPHEKLRPWHLDEPARVEPVGRQAMSDQAAPTQGAGAPPTQVWQARYNRGPRSDTPYDLVVGPDKSVYTTGRSRVPSTSVSQMITIKVRPDGQVHWRKRYSAPGAYVDGQALAIDSEGNTYVAGRLLPANGFSRYLIIKYSPTGRRVWKKDLAAGELGGVGHAIAVDIEVDSFDNVYVTGQMGSAEDGSGYDAMTLKFDPLGNELWRDRYSGGFSGNQRPRAMAVSPEGDIVIAANGPGPNGFPDFETLKYSPEGLLLWTKRISGISFQKDRPQALAIAQSGNIHVAGYRGRISSRSPFAAFLALDTLSHFGSRKWRRKHQGIEHEATATSVDVDGEGSVFVTGLTLEGGFEAGSTYYDFVTIKYSSTGRPLWKRKWASQRPLWLDQGVEVRATGDGGAIVVGQGEPPGRIRDDYVLIRYSAAGDVDWIYAADVPGMNDHARAMELDEDGGIYVTGTSDNGRNDDILTIKLQQ